MNLFKSNFLSFLPNIYKEKSEYFLFIYFSIFSLFHHFNQTEAISDNHTWKTKKIDRLHCTTSSTAKLKYISITYPLRQQKKILNFQNLRIHIHNSTPHIMNLSMGDGMKRLSVNKIHMTRDLPHLYMKSIEEHAPIRPKNFAIPKSDPHTTPNHNGASLTLSPRRVVASTHPQAY